MIESNTSAQSIDSYLNSYYTGLAIQQALDYQLFHYLEDSPKSIQKISLHTKLPTYFTSALLGLLAEHKFIDSTNEGYQTSALMKEWLSSNQGQTQFHFVQKQINKNISEISNVKNRKKHFFKYLKKQFQHRVLKNKKYAFYSSENTPEDFTAFAHSGGYSKGTDFLKLFDLSAQNIKTVTDIGGSAGAFLFPLAKKHPNIDFFSYDLKEIEPIFTANKKNKNYPDNLSFIAGDFFKDKLLPSSDAYTCGFIFHDWSSEVSLHLAQLIAKSMLSGNLLYLHENLLDHPLRKKDLAIENYKLICLGYNGGSYIAGEKTSQQYIQLFKKYNLKHIETRFSDYNSYMKFVKI